MSSSESVILDTENVTVTIPTTDMPVSDDTTSSVQEEILVQLEVTNNLLGKFYALAIFCFAFMFFIFFYKIITNNVTKHIFF